jgi:putative ABC transport system permease protein
VVTEIALSLILLIGAGLMIKSFVRLNHVNPGFNETNILTLKTNLPAAKYNSSSKQLDFYQQVLDRIRALPGVQSADAVSVLPTKGSTYTDDFLTIDGRPSVEPGTGVLHNVVTPNYFATMKIPVISGRSFSEADTGQNLVVVISDQLAHRSFSGQSPIGQRVKFARPQDQRDWYTIVGVVGDVKQEGMAVETRPEVYEPFPQMANSYMNFVVRTSGDPNSLIPSVRAEIKAVDKDVPPYNISSMDEVLSMNVKKQQFTMLLLIVFAAMALLLASIGIYGVLSYAVSQRTSEMGIRMALGAERRNVLTLVIGQGFKLIIIGLVVGLIGAFGLTRLMITLLFNVRSTDPGTFAVVAVFLALTGLAACYIPARRATRINPLIALRYE